MAAQITVYSLYEVIDKKRSHFAIVKAIRKEYANHIQDEEEQAWQQLKLTTTNIIKDYCDRITANYKFLAHYFGFPEGSIFYSNNSCFEATVWLTTTKDELFVFGQCDTEKQFWQSIEQDYRDGECWFYSKLKRPAEKHNVMFLDSGSSNLSSR